MRVAFKLLAQLADCVLPSSSSVPSLLKFLVEDVASGTVFSKMIINAGLFHDLICGVPDFDFPVYRYVSACYRAEPNVMISLAVAHEITVMFP